MDQEKKILYIDMDNVLVDFQSGIDQLSELEKEQYAGRYDEAPNIFSKMVPLEGAIEAFNTLNPIYDIYILSTSPWGNETAASEKVAWVKKYLGEPAKKRLILSHHKNLNIGDYLVDDRTANGAINFGGVHVMFGTEPYENWGEVTRYLLERHHDEINYSEEERYRYELKQEIFRRAQAQPALQDEIINLIIDLASRDSQFLKRAKDLQDKLRKYQALSEDEKNRVVSTVESWHHSAVAEAKSKGMKRPTLESIFKKLEESNYFERSAKTLERIYYDYKD